MEDVDADIAAAATEAAAEVGVEVKPEVEELPQADEVAEPEKEDVPPVEEQAPEKTEDLSEEEAEDFGLSAEQLERINKDEDLRAHYRSMQKGFTKKSQALAESRKADKAKLEMANWIEENPDKALEILAEKRGRRIAPSETEEKKAEVVDELMSEWVKALGEEPASQFYPLLKRTVESLYEGKIQPVNEQLEAQRRTTFEREQAAGVHEFCAQVKESGRPMDESIQKDMAAKMASLSPGEGTNLNDYLNALYSAAMYERSQLGSKKETLARLRKATATEPVGSTRPTGPASKAITADMTDDEAFAMATAMAEEIAQNM